MCVVLTNALRSACFFASQNRDGLVISPDSKFVYSAHYGKIFIFTIVDTSLIYVGVFDGDVEETGGGAFSYISDIEGMALSIDGSHMYLALDSENSVAVLRRDATTGLLEFLQILQSGDIDVNGVSIPFLDDPETVVVRPDSKFVYFSADSSGSSMLVFEPYVYRVSE